MIQNFTPTTKLFCNFNENEPQSLFQAEHFSLFSISKLKGGEGRPPWFNCVVWEGVGDAHKLNQGWVNLLN